MFLAFEYSSRCADESYLLRAGCALFTSLRRGSITSGLHQALCFPGGAFGGDASFMVIAPASRSDLSKASMDSRLVSGSILGSLPGRLALIRSKLHMFQFCFWFGVSR